MLGLWALRNPIEKEFTQAIERQNVNGKKQRARNDSLCFFIGIRGATTEVLIYVVF